MTPQIFQPIFKVTEQREGFVYEIQIIEADVLWQSYSGERTA